MKRLLSLTLFLSLIPHVAFGQSRDISLKPGVDYSQYSVPSNTVECQLQGIGLNDYFTGVFFRYTVKTKDAGGLLFRDDITISGPFGYLSPVGMWIGGKEWPFGKTWEYGRGNKDKYVDVVIFFNRIPAGVESINYNEPDFVSWEGVPVQNNEDPVPHTNWSEESLRTYWESNPCSSIEGIYYFTSTSDKKWWGSIKHTLAVIMNGYQYEVIYLKGANKNIWREGDLKAIFTATATPGLYKATTWFMENRLENDDFYLKFTDGYMSIYENTASVSADFLKLYPANDVNVSGGGIPSPTTRPSSSNTNMSVAPKASGSGVFVSNKVIATNYHVIEGANKIEVSIKTGKDIFTYEAKVIVTDKTNDLALITIEDTSFKGIGELPYALSSKTRDVGTAVFTMGYPMANYMGEEVKITDGIISSKTGYEGDIVTYQISAPIQPGNSGGPLFDKNGNLIGITNAGIRGAQNVGYAIKSSYLYNLIESAPISINISEKNSLIGKDLTEQVKALSKYIVFIKIY